MSDPQFKVRSFPRGVKLTRQNVWTPAQDIQSATSNAALTGQQMLAPFKLSWTFSMQSETFGSNPAGKTQQQLAQVVLPMIFPPPQGVFDASTKQYTAAPELTQISIGMDQRANPLGISDEWMVWPPADPPRPDAPKPGYLVQADLSRYDTTLKLIQKVPTVFDVNGSSETYQEVLTLFLPGADLFGAAALNPYVIEGVSQYLNPYGVYYWTIQTPGLAALNGTDAVQTSGLVVTGTPAGGAYKTYVTTVTQLNSLGSSNSVTLTGNATYTYNCSIGNTQQDVVNGLLLLAAGDEKWTFTDGGGSTGYAPGTGHIVGTYKVLGTTTDVVTSSSSTPLVITAVTTNPTVGSLGNTLAVSDGTNPYTYTILTTDTLATATAGLAAAINGHNGYTATADANVVTVFNEPGVSFAFTDVSYNSEHMDSPCYIFFALSWPLLAMPNFNLTCSFRFPLEQRDYSASTSIRGEPYVQNIPTKHLGQPQTGTMEIPTIPAADAVITGDDVQALVVALEQPLLNGLKAGYGTYPGSEADTFPWEQLAADAGYQAINVQMFPNWWDVRRRSINPTSPLPYGVGFPYCSGSPPYENAIPDQRILRVPTGFVVHHVIACQNTFPYPDNRIFPQGANWGTPLTATQKVSVSLYNGLRSDDLSGQTVAYLEWTDAAASDYLIDNLKLDRVHTNFLTLNVPIVWDTDTNGNSSYGGSAVATGKPFWMGAGNSTTAARTLCSQMPYNFGGTTPITPPTGGGENLLIVRWSIQAAGGLGQDNDEVVTGPGGHHIIIIGKQSTVGADTNGKVVSSNPIVGPW